jgi:hypothetical protein
MLPPDGGARERLYPWAKVRVKVSIDGASYDLLVILGRPSNLRQMIFRAISSS